jgi:hypothetical protein
MMIVTIDDCCIVLIPHCGCAARYLLSEYLVVVLVTCCSNMLLWAVQLVYECMGSLGGGGNRERERERER